MSTIQRAKRPASRPKPALDTLLSKEIVGPIIRRARWLNTLEHHLHTRLPSPLNLHVRLANVQEDTLVYLVDSPIWHARLRLSRERLLEVARDVGLQVRSLRIRTAQQPFDHQLSALEAIDARMRRNHGTTPTEAHALAKARALLGESHHVSS